ncbi:MAG: hypothetical protein V4760_14810 [Bdellovibrionota bacterium]
MRTQTAFAILFVVTILVSGCSSLRKSANSIARSLHLVEHVEVKAPPKEAPSSYKSAMGLLEDSKFAEALEAFDAFGKAEPASPYSQAAILNSGRALEGLGRWSEATERYRAVVRVTANARKLQAMALYRLSICHEALGDDLQVVATLNDLLSRMEELPPEMARAELPARLATAYARVGNFDRAIDFYRQAENGIAKLRQEAGDDVPEWLPRTLFFMGELSRRSPTWAEFESSMRPLGRGQVYLLQAAELEAAPWSEKAADELIGTYSNLWTAIASAPVPSEGDPLLATRALQLKQWERSILLLDSLAELRARILPREAATRSAAAKRIAKAMEDLEKEIGKLLLERPAGEGLTREALLRRQSVRAKVVAPNDALERRFIETSREVPPLKKMKPDAPRVKSFPKKKKSEQFIESPTPAPTAPPASSPTPIPTAPPEDPNL